MHYVLGYKVVQYRCYGSSIHLHEATHGGSAVTATLAFLQEM